MGFEENMKMYLMRLSFFRGGGRVTPLYGLFGDVPLNRVWLLTSLSHRVYFFVLPARLIWFARRIFVLALILSFVGVIKLRVLSYGRVCILGIFFPNQGQGFKLSVTHLYPNIGLIPPPPPVVFVKFTQVKNLWLCGTTSWVYSFPFYAG